MATQTGPDLTPAQAAIERLMDDTCTIRRDPGGVQDDTLDTTTGVLTPVDNSALVYEGKCMVKAAQGYVGSEEGGRFRVTRTYYVTIPLSAPEVLEGDVVKVTSSRRDSQLVNKSLTVTDPVYGTMKVSRRVEAKLVKG